MGEVKTLLLAHEHGAGSEFAVQPAEQISALYKVDRDIKIIGSILGIHISTTPMVDVTATAELTLEPRVTADVYTDGEMSEPARIINFHLFHRQVLTSGAIIQPSPTVIMFPDGDVISVAKDTTINLIDRASIAGQRGTTFSLIFYKEK